MRSLDRAGAAVRCLSVAALVACGGGSAETRDDGTVLHRLPPRRAEAPPAEPAPESPVAAHAPPRQLSAAPGPREDVVGRGPRRVRIEVAPPEGVSWGAAGCPSSARETCNGLDDDCDGRIDDGCGYSSGDIQVTLAWGSRSDLDLTVANPNGDVVSWRTEQGYDGGQMDHRTERCEGSRLGTSLPGSMASSASRIENVFFTVPSHSRSGAVARGRYVVAIRASDMCDETSTPATLSLSVQGKVVAVMQLQFERYDESFTIPFTLTDAT